MTSKNANVRATISNSPKKPGGSNAPEAGGVQTSIPKQRKTAKACDRCYDAHRKVEPFGVHDVRLIHAV